MDYTPSREDYLISVYLLQQKGEDVRSVHIAQLLGYSKPSVYSGVHLLLENGLLVMDERKILSLTPEGEEKAKQIYGRFQTVYLLFTEIFHIPERTAYRDACRMEHVISGESLGRIRAFYALRPPQPGPKPKA